MLLIDGNMLAHRCFAKMDFLKSSAGVSTGMEYGYLRTVESLQKKYPDQRAVHCFDSPTSTGEHGERRQKYAGYKANRKPKGAPFYERLRELKRFVSCFWTTAEEPGCEADDLMYTLSCDDGPHRIYTNDDDLLQAVDDARDVRTVKSFKSKLYEWSEQTVLDRYGVPPHLLPYFRAFIGDKSDNLPGVKRVNRRYLADVLLWCDQYDFSVERIILEVVTADWSALVKKRLTAFVDSGDWLRNFELMKLAPVEVKIHQPKADFDFVIEKLRAWEIRTLKLCEPFKESLSKLDDDEEF